MRPTEDEEMRRFAAGEVVWVLTGEATRDAGSVKYGRDGGQRLTAGSPETQGFHYEANS